MPEVEQAPHLGIIKTTTMKHNIQTNVDENITKARRSAYSIRGLVVQEVLRTVIIAPYRKEILVLCRFCRCVVGTRDPGRCVHEIHIRIDCMHYVLL
jgi:hypothetical protein